MAASNGSKRIKDTAKRSDVLECMDCDTMERACKICKHLTDGKECPLCKNKELTRNWKGVVLIFDPDSEIAKATGHAVPGKYALQVL